jgi:hypothetical protein
MIIHKCLSSIPAQLQGLNCDGGDHYAIQSHHIFLRARLERAGYDSGHNHHDRKRVNKIANRVPLTESGNPDIFDSRLTEYLPPVHENHLGALEPAFTPRDERLRKTENDEEFLTKRQQLTAEGINDYLDGLVEDSFLRPTTNQPMI